MIARMQRARRSGGAVEYEAGGSTLVGFGTPRDSPSVPPAPSESMRSAPVVPSCGISRYRARSAPCTAPLQ